MKYIKKFETIEHKKWKHVDIDDIINYVTYNHGDQKYGNNKPYVYHLEKVKNVCERFIDLYNFSEYEKYVIIVSAWCHDLIEDTDVTYDEIVDKFGEDVARIVHNLSGFGINRIERNKNAYNKIKGDKISTFVKLCDRISNTEESLTIPRKMIMYSKEFNSFKENLKIDGELEEMWDYLEKLYKL